MSWLEGLEPDTLETWVVAIIAMLVYVLFLYFGVRYLWNRGLERDGEENDKAK